jgi:hypothetical protein
MFTPKKAPGVTKNCFPGLAFTQACMKALTSTDWHEEPVFTAS